MNNRLLVVLSVRPFLFLWLAEVFSQIAMNMVNFILIFVAFALTKSNTAVSGIVLAFTLPAILFGIFAGVFVDRWNKKHVLFATNVIRVFLLLLLVLLYKNLFFVYALTFLISVVTQFFIPAETPMIPLLVKKDLLYAANALFGLGIYGSVLVSYALASPLLLLYGKTDVFLLLSFFFLVAGIFILLIKDPYKTLHTDKKTGQEGLNVTKSVPTGKKELQSTFGGEVKSMFTLIVKTKEIYHSLFLLTLSQILTLVLAVIGPGYASQVLGIRVDALPLFFMTPAALGMVIGAIILINFFHNNKKSKSATVGVFLLGIAIMLLPYGSKVASRTIVHSINMYLPHVLTITILHIMVFLAFVLGFANALVWVPSNTILQEETSDAFRGKIYGALNALVGIFSFFPVIVVGGLADLFGVSSVLTGIGISLLLIGFFRVGFLNKNSK